MRGNIPLNESSSCVPLRVCGYGAESQRLWQHLRPWQLLRQLTAERLRGGGESSLAARSALPEKAAKMLALNVLEISS